MNQYSPIFENAALARGQTVAVQAGEDIITYESLLKRCKALQNTWDSHKASHVALCVRGDLDTVIGMFALHYCGYTVSLFRSPRDEIDAEVLTAMQVDHILDTNTWSLEAIASKAQWQTRQSTPGQWLWDDVAFQIQTSGTTAAAEWIPLTIRQLHLSAFGSAIRLGHLPGDRWLNPLSPGFMGWLAICTRCALYGTTMVICTPREIGAKLSQEHVTQVSLVPSMLRQLMDTHSEALAQLRTVLVGGSSTPPELVARCIDAQISIATTWGMTEAASQVATQHPEAPNASGHVGPPMPFVQVNLVNERFVLTGPLLNQPLETNDTGFIDEDNHVHVSGRVDDVIVTSGLKLMPSHVETQLRHLLPIEDVCVFGLPDETWGEIVAAVIVPNDSEDSAFEANRLLSVMSSMKTHHKPRRLWQADKVPTNDMQKPLRRLIRDVCLKLNETVSSELIEKERRQGDGLESVQINRRVGKADTRPEHPSSIDNIVSKDKGASTHSNNPTFNGQFIPLADGFTEVTFSVNEGQSHRMCVKELIPVAEDRKENFFEGDVSVFEDTTKENDARAVNLVESGSEIVTKRHDVNLLRRKGKAKL